MNPPDSQQPGAPDGAPAQLPVQESCWREFWDVLTDALAHADAPSPRDHGEVASLGRPGVSR